MTSLNKVLLIGNLTKDPELRYTQSGLAVCDVRLAVNRRFQGQNGETRDETCFLDVTVFGKRGEAFGRFFQKGKPVYIEGRLKQDTWDDKQTGQKRSKLTVVAEDWQFVGPAQQGAGGGGGMPSGRGRAAGGGFAAPAEEAGGAEFPTEEGAATDETPF